MDCYEVENNPHTFSCPKTLSTDASIRLSEFVFSTTSNRGLSGLSSDPHIWRQADTQESGWVVSPFGLISAAGVYAAGSRYGRLGAAVAGIGTLSLSGDAVPMYSGADSKSRVAAYLGCDAALFLGGLVMSIPRLKLAGSIVAGLGAAFRLVLPVYLEERAAD